ncbi:protein THYLAKOID ASSEMBLY 8-like, chloroplastic [Telopea speciosissima]|uniref:protein THYLAKOID ASSEMBLY 8-like, chloroplastic n=1 Tax=Telopea speciosissima TaxID=54955 RepID=UPI001CC4FE3E|nr:protein THYLAKOID ASSEMBLY 8-like, chloroplastic [Telopea speciosissima]XP_043708947.1 protein THYLAKOID ASSEMBLY 8-like, chloroplastic [Telopea speciosissima]
MHSYASRIPSEPMLYSSQTCAVNIHGSLRIVEAITNIATKRAPTLQLAISKSKGRVGVITMRDRSKNRKPLQRGRNLSIEAIQTVQALKRAKKDINSLEREMEYKVRRLLKFDLMAVLRELLRQNEPLLALKVFQEVQKEYWYKPQVLLYADMINVLASNGMLEMVERLFLYLKMESSLDADTEGFTALLKTLIEFGTTRLVMDCFHLMKAVGCEPDKSTFRILIDELELKGETTLSAIVRKEAEKHFGGSLEFLEEKQDLTLSSN